MPDHLPDLSSQIIEETPEEAVEYTMPNNPPPVEAPAPIDELDFTEGDEMDLPDGEVLGAIDEEDPDLNDYLPEQLDEEDTNQWSNDGITQENELEGADNLSHM